MGILNEFERRLEGVVEGVFTMVFRSGLHPVEIARRLLKEMEDGRTVGVRGVWVPNHFVVRLSAADLERFRGTENALRRELRQVVRDEVAERGWGLVGPPEVLLEADGLLRQGAFEIEASLVEGPQAEEPAAASGDLPPEAVPTGERAAHDDEGTRAPFVSAPALEPRAELVLIERGRPGRTFALAAERTVIGRLPESDVPVRDPGASRRHAEIRREDGEYVLADLGSTNGTLVNEASVGERALCDGDRITIGETVLEFRRR